MRGPGLVLLFSLLFSSPNIAASPFPEREVVVLDVPFVQQEKNACGAAALAMVFKFWGKNISQYSVLKGTYNESRKGIRGEDLQAYAENNGFEAFLYGGELDHLKANVKKGRPVIVALDSGSSASFHYVVVVGYDDKASKIIVNDPQRGKLKSVPVHNFLSRWSRSRYWSLLLVPKSSPAQPSTTESRGSYR
jgi:ABC-type bacteriocin/lantibiotic exporter with double-glycine peptidase domain